MQKKIKDDIDACRNSAESYIDVFASGDEALIFKAAKQLAKVSACVFSHKIPSDSVSAEEVCAYADLKLAPLIKKVGEKERALPSEVRAQINAMRRAFSRQLELRPEESFFEAYAWARDYKKMIEAKRGKVSASK